LSPINSWLLACLGALMPAIAGAVPTESPVVHPSLGPQLALLHTADPAFQVSIPSFHPAFEFYRMTAVENAGVCAMLASTRGYARDQYGGGAKTAFGLVRAHITETYGAADEFTDTIRPASHWKAPQEWVHALFLKDRVYQAEWHAPAGGTFQGQVTHIVLAVQAVESSRAFVTLLYQFDDAHCRGVEPRTEPPVLMMTR
jgi:hypothetical protein